MWKVEKINKISKFFFFFLNGKVVMDASTGLGYLHIVRKPLCYETVLSFLLTEIPKQLRVGKGSLNS